MYWSEKSCILFLIKVYFNFSIIIIIILHTALYIFLSLQFTWIINKTFTGHFLEHEYFVNILLKGPHQFYYMCLSSVNISHIGHIKSIHFPQKSFIYDIWCLFVFCPYSINVTESIGKCVTTLVYKNICVKNHHANIWAREAALVRNYFSRRDNFHLNGSWLPSLFLCLSLSLF